MNAILQTVRPVLGLVVVMITYSGFMLALYGVLGKIGFSD